MDEYDRTADFFDAAIRVIGESRDAGRRRVLDLGTGTGKLVLSLQRLGYDALGCDVRPYWKDTESSGAFSLIQTEPYRLPYDDGSLDIVLSNSVLEHAQNKPELFREVHRVLRPGGCSMHLFPSHWYLPSEPHIYVPLANYFPSGCPRWWLALWALLGVRNEFQQGLSWRAAVDANTRYFLEGLSYWTKSQYRRESETVFGNFSMPMDFYVEHASGGAAKLFRRLHWPKLTGWLVGTFREAFIVHRKADS